jgi:hypothetical protein
MSTEFKALERVDRKAAYELQEKIDEIRSNAENAAKKAREKALRESESKIQQIRQENIQRERQIIQSLRSETDNKLAQQDAEHRAALLDMSESLQKKLDKQSDEFGKKLENVIIQNQNDINKLRIETHGLINDLTTDINNAFKEQIEINKSHQNQINHIKNDVRSLQQNISDQKSWAKELLKNCKLNLSEMENDIAVKRFQKQELERAKISVLNAENLIENSPQAAIGNLTESRIDLMEIREKSQISQAIFESLYQQSLSGIKTLIEKTEHSKQNTKTQDTDVDLVFWTNGRYTEFEEKVNALEQKIKTALQNPEISTEDMTNIIKEISLLESEEEDLVKEAVSNIELSQNRVETANEIINKLLSDGNYILKNDDDEGYISDDFREGYFATLVDNGNQDISMTVMVESVLDETDNSVKNMVYIQRNGNVKQNDILVQENRDLIKKFLSKDGDNVSNIDLPDAKVFDSNAMKSKKLTKDQKVKLKLKLKL